jgi:putative N6-adenine-specific DNA methylase
MYLYEKRRQFFAQCADDIKNLAEQELKSHGATQSRQAYRGIYFNADNRVLYAVSYHSRLINRVLAPLVSFDCKNDSQLYRNATQIEWEKLFAVRDTFAVFATVSHSIINHSQFAALRVKDAVVDRFRTHTGRRPSVDPKEPSLWINLYIENNVATISIDTSGGSLHRRGYRRRSVKAPMIETLAASIIRISGWDGSTPLYDPFCGSGTLLCEAYLHATRTPAAILRNRFGFKHLPDFDSKVWKQVKRQAISDIRPAANGLIAGSDFDMKAVKAAQYNCSFIDKNKCIEISRRNVFDIESLEGKTIVCNPPFGMRAGTRERPELFYRRLGYFLKLRAKGSTAYVYFGDYKQVKSLGLKPSWKKPLENGGLDGRLVKYELY